MATVKKYTKKDGTTAYMFRAYLGIDPQTGKAKRTTRRGFNTERSAKIELKRVEFEATQGITQKQECNKTFEQVYHEWYESYINTVRESTWARTDGMFENHVLPALGRYRIRTITTAQCQKALNKWFKITTHNYKGWFNYTKSVFEYAIRQGYITDNPAKRTIMPKKHANPGKEVPNFWDKYQLQTFFSYIDPDKELERYTLFRLLAFTGIRRGECLALTWDDVSIKNSTLNVNKTLTQGARGKQIIQATKTKKGNRIISLDSTTIFYLKKWQFEQKRNLFMLGFNNSKKDQLLFATTKNTLKSLNTPKKWLDIITNRMKLDNVTLPHITIHGFRHSHASALFAAGATIKEVQERLGHEDAQTTLNIYTHVTEKQDQEAVQKLVNFLDF
ncbi:site-specific integrase [Companilactobacillus kedongensis]|uniref:site-specific integrase n=1 Tax=Companilactobacillus kedongensis TaxID=2486004 RepID=UPI000F7A6CAA|nr:site-specific integrase [Companilactobacillus kedongensis]